MYDIDIIIPSWKKPELLRVMIPFLKSSLTTNSRIIIVLNEVDPASKKILDSHNIIHIDRENNIGPSSVDYALPIIDSKYVVNANNDMIFAPGWDRVLIDTLEEYYPATASCLYLENNGPLFFRDNIGPFNVVTGNKFLSNFSKGKYNHLKKVYSVAHPIICRTEDYKAVNGYSDNFDKEWISCFGRGLDYHFAWRLLQLNKDYRFIMNPKAVVFHGSSLTRIAVEKEGPRNVFESKTGILPKDFVASIRNLKEV